MQEKICHSKDYLSALLLLAASNLAEACSRSPLEEDLQYQSDYLKEPDQCLYQLQSELATLKAMLLQVAIQALKVVYDFLVDEEDQHLIPYLQFSTDACLYPLEIVKNLSLGYFVDHQEKLVSFVPDLSLIHI